MMIWGRPYAGYGAGEPLLRRKLLIANQPVRPKVRDLDF
jgi:hypothetical protein